MLGAARAATRYMVQYFRHSDTASFHEFRQDIGRAMLIGLEFLVAGDIIRTVVVAHTLEDVASLGLLVLIRTVVVFTIHVELEGRWPWQGQSH